MVDWESGWQSPWIWQQKHEPSEPVWLTGCPVCHLIRKEREAEKCRGLKCGRGDKDGEMWRKKKMGKVKTCRVGDVKLGGRGEHAQTPSEPVW